MDKKKTKSINKCRCLLLSLINIEISNNLKNPFQLYINGKNPKDINNNYNNKNNYEIFINEGIIKNDINDGIKYSIINYKNKKNNKTLLFFPGFHLNNFKIKQPIKKLISKNKIININRTNIPTIINNDEKNNFNIGYIFLKMLLNILKSSSKDVKKYSNKKNKIYMFEKKKTIPNNYDFKIRLIKIERNEK